MARPKNPSPQLKKDLAQASRRLVDELGPDGLTLRAAARESGVSSNAPYLYFPGGVPELLASVASEGFDALLAVLHHRPAALPVDRVRELVRRYVRFGVERPNLYRAMFHARLAGPLDDETGAQDGEATFQELRVLKERAYDLLVMPLEELRTAGSLRGKAMPHGAPGLALAALAHGLVGEFIDEGLWKPTEGNDPWTSKRRSVVAVVTDVLLHGLLARHLSVAQRVSASPSSSNQADKNI